MSQDLCKRPVAWFYYEAFKLCVINRRKKIYKDKTKSIFSVYNIFMEPNTFLCGNIITSQYL